MKIVLIGATGYLGSNLNNRLEALGYEIITDISEIPFIKDYVLINCAGELYYKGSMFTSNIELVNELLELAKSTECKKFIQIGSSSELGLSNDLRKESYHFQPTSLYGATKLAATNLCLGFAHEYNLNLTVARLGGFYGKNDKSSRLIPRILHSYRTNSQLEISPGSMDWTYIDDIINGIILLIKSNEIRLEKQIVNLSSGISYNNYNVVHLFEELTKYKFNIKYNQLPIDKIVTDYHLPNTKAQLLLNWQPRYSLIDGLREVLKS